MEIVLGKETEWIEFKQTKPHFLQFLTVKQGQNHLIDEKKDFNNNKGSWHFAI